MQTKVKFLGHAAIQLETGGSLLLIDPYLKRNPKAAVKPEEVSPDYILVTHGHGDHIGDTVEIAKRTGAMVISNAEICDWLEENQVKTHALHLGGGHTFPFGYLKMTFALHGSSMPDGSYGGNPGGFLLTTKSGEKLYFAGDTGLFGDMRLIGEEGLTLAVIPIGDNYTMGPDDALRAVKLLQPKVVIPIHYNTNQLLKQDAGAWKSRVESETNTRVQILDPGQELAIGL